MSDADKQWGSRLKQARLAAGLSQKMLGIEAGIDEFVASTRINRYELGVHRPDLLTVRKLAKALDVPVAFFFADEDDELAELLLIYGKAKVSLRREALNRPLKKSPADAGLGQYDLKRSANNPDEDDERQPRLPGGDVQLHQP